MGTARRLVAFDVFLLASCVLAAIASLVVHEVLGHTLTAWVLGGKILGVRLSLFGGGVARAELPDGASALARGAFAASGIVVEIVLGIAALVAARRGPLALRLGLLCFAAIAVLESLGYAAFGLYYGWGDPAEIAELLGARPSSFVLHESRAWVPFAIALVPASALFARLYLDVQEQVFPAARLRERFVHTAATMGFALFTVFALQATVGETTSPVRRTDMRREWVEGRRVVAMARATRDSMPGASEEEVRAAIVAKLPAVRAEPVDLPPELPLQRILLALVTLGGIGAVVAARPRPKVPSEISVRTALGAGAAALAAGAVVLLL